MKSNADNGSIKVGLAEAEVWISAENKEGDTNSYKAWNTKAGAIMHTQ